MVTNPLPLTQHPIRRNNLGVASLAALLFVLLSLLAVNIGLEHRHAIDRAMLQATKLTELLAFEVNDLFRDVSEMQQALERLLPQPGQELVGGTSVNEWLRAFTDSTTGVDSLNIIDAAGTLRHSSVDGLATVTVADRDHFQVLRDNRDQQTSFSELLISRTTGKPSMVQLYALRDEQGQFIGAIGAVINPQRFDSLHRVSIDPNGVALLRRSDTTNLIARYPQYAEADFNRPLPSDNPIRQQVLAGERSGSLRYTASTDGVRRIGSFQVLEDYPFYIQVAVSEAYALAGWWRHVAQVSGLATLLVLGAALGLRRWRQTQQAEQAALETILNERNRLKVICDTLGQGLYLTDAEGRIITINPHAQHLLGYSEAELQGQWAHKLFHQHKGNDFQSASHCPIIQAVRAGQEYRDETVFKRADGRLFETLVVSRPLMQQGRFAGAVTVFEDITTRKHAERALKQAQRLLQAALENSPWGILIVDAPDGRVRFTNRVAQAIRHAGVDSDAPLLDIDFSQYVTHWQILQPDRAPLPLEQWPLSRVITSGETIKDEEVLIVDGEGVDRWLSVSAAPIRDDDGAITAGIAVFADITLQKQTSFQLQRRAYYDALTGLPNRILLADRLEQAMERAPRMGHYLALVFIDLDNFKPVNDQHGHATGDVLLIAVAERMHKSLRSMDTLARLGGDEFVAVLSDLNQPSDAQPLLQRLLDACSAPLKINGLTLQVSASIGVTFYPQATAATLNAEQLLHQADQAMYQAKMKGRNTWHGFEPDHGATNRRI